MLTVGVLLVRCSSSRLSRHHQAKRRDVDAYVLAEMELNSIPGLSLVIVEDGAVSYLRAYGVRSTASRETMSMDTPVELASVSKSFTALAILRLEHDGLIRRDTPVRRYLPGLDETNWRGVTVRHLLQHRSGLRRGHDFQIPCCGAEGELDLLQAVEELAEADLESAPGETFAYANSNYVLLSAIVERTSGVSFPKYMREELFLPLGLKRTTVDEIQAGSWGRAEPHEWQWGAVRVSPSRFLGWFGASLVKSSASDMGTYLTLLLNPARAGEHSSFLDPNWWEGLETSYDLGWFIHAEDSWPEGQLALEHGGDIWGGNTAVVLLPRKRAAVAVLTNSGSERANPIAKAILGALDSSELPPPGQMSLADIPDVWARSFLAFAAVLLVAMAAYSRRVLRQMRCGARAWQAKGLRLVRAAILSSLAFVVVYYAFGGSGPPLAAFPTTIQVALPVLVFTVSAVLLFAAAVGVLPRRTGAE